MRTQRAAFLGILLLTACGGEVASSSASISPAASADNETPSQAAPSEAATPSPNPTPSQGPSAFAGAWMDATSEEMASVGEWTNKVELADLDVDGDLDILFANGGDYETPGTPVASSAWLNDGAATFTNATAEILGDHALLTRVIKVADLNADSFPDIVMGTVYTTQSRLLLSTGPMTWTDATATHFPDSKLSVGDLEIGDVDADGDLDIALTNWGVGSPFGPGGRKQLWRNDGSGDFTDDTEAAMPRTPVAFSWDIELVDVDNDWSLDLAISCKFCETSLLFMNDGFGTYTDETAERIPPSRDNYEFAPIDLDGDGFLDLVTINDGIDFTERALHNDGTGTFVDNTDAWWPDEANPSWDDNVIVGLDIESDGDADFVIGSLDGPDRLLINDGSGNLTLALDAFEGARGMGTLMMATADLNGDGRPDIVEAQGEVPGHEAERLYLGSEVLPPDSAAPFVRAAVEGDLVLARVHDNRTPNLPDDWTSVVARWDGGEAPMTWYGENLFRVALPAGASAVEVCAVDAAGNEGCGAP